MAEGEYTSNNIQHNVYSFRLLLTHTAAECLLIQWDVLTLNSRHRVNVGTLWGVFKMSVHYYILQTRAHASLPAGKMIICSASTTFDHFLFVLLPAMLLPEYPLIISNKRWNVAVRQKACREFRDLVCCRVWLGVIEHLLQSRIMKCWYGFTKKTQLVGKSAEWSVIRRSSHLLQACNFRLTIQEV